MAGNYTLGGAMGRVVDTLLVGVLVLAPVPAGAQKAVARLGVGASATYPVGQFHNNGNGDGFNVGWQGMAMLDYGVPSRSEGLRLEGVYGENTANAQFLRDAESLLGPGVNAKVRMYGGDIDLILKQLPKAAGKPTTYVLGGLGVRRISDIATQGSLSQDTSGTKFAWNIGGGLYLGGKASLVFLEARYVHVEPFNDVSSNHFPVTLGVRFGLAR